VTDIEGIRQTDDAVNAGIGGKDGGEGPCPTEVIEGEIIKRGLNGDGHETVTPKMISKIPVESILWSILREEDLGGRVDLKEGGIITEKDGGQDKNQ